MWYPFSKLTSPEWAGFYAHIREYQPTFSEAHSVLGMGLYAGWLLLWVVSAFCGKFENKRNWVCFGLPALVLGAMAIRHVPMAMAISFPVVMLGLQGAHAPKVLVAGLALWAGAAGLFGLGRGNPYLGVATEHFPVKAQAFLEKHQITDRVFNTYNDGGFLLHEGASKLVFIDSHPESALGFMNDYFKAHESRASFIAFLAEHNVKAALVPLVDGPGEGEHTMTWLWDARNWRLVHMDAGYAVFLEDRAYPHIQNLSLDVSSPYGLYRSHPFIERLTRGLQHLVVFSQPQKPWRQVLAWRLREGGFEELAQNVEKGSQTP